MIRSLFSFFVVVCAAIGISRAREPESSDKSPNVAGDSRILADICKLRLDRLSPQAEGQAVVRAHISTDGPFSRGVSDAPYFEISVSVVEKLAGPVAVERWKFTRPLRGALDGFGDRLIAAGDPFESHGECDAVLLIFAAGNRVEIVETFAIPTEWAAGIAEAYGYCRAHPALFSEPPSPDAKATLYTLLAGANSPLAVSAALALSADAANVPALAAEIAASKNIRQAALMLVLLRNAKPSKETLNDIMARLADTIRKTKNLEELHGLALGAYWAGKGRERTADDLLLGNMTPYRFAELSVADRLQPLLIRNIRWRLVGLDPGFADTYVAYLVGLGSGPRSRETKGG